MRGDLRRGQDQRALLVERGIALVRVRNAARVVAGGIELERREPVARALGGVVGDALVRAPAVV